MGHAVMTSVVPPARRIELLLNTLHGERYLRRPLLTEVLEQLADTHARVELLRAVRALLDRLEEGISEADYEGQLALVLDELIPASAFRHFVELVRGRAQRLAISSSTR